MKYLVLSFVISGSTIQFNPIALRKDKTPLSFGLSECNRIKPKVTFLACFISLEKCSLDLRSA